MRNKDTKPTQALGSIRISKCLLRVNSSKIVQASTWNARWSAITQSPTSKLPGNPRESSHPHARRDYHQHTDHSITRVCWLHDRGRFWLDAIRCISVGDISKFETLYETLWWKESRTQHLSLRRQCTPIRAYHGSYILPQIILRTSLTTSPMNTPYTFLYLSGIKIITPSCKCLWAILSRNVAKHDASMLIHMSTLYQGTNSDCNHHLHHNISHVSEFGISDLIRWSSYHNYAST